MNRAGTSAVEIVHRLVKKLDLLAIVAVVAATSALFWLVPALPLAHLDDPSHWGVLGYAITLVVILTLRLRGIQGSGVERFWRLYVRSGSSREGSAPTQYGTSPTTGAPTSFQIGMS